jgi:hypothetical protein
MKQILKFNLIKASLSLIKDNGHTVEITTSALPLLGEVSINDNSIVYTPSGEFGGDSLTISIADNTKTIEQKFEFIITDRSPRMVLSNPLYGVSTELENGVTVWGYNFGEQQNESTIELCDLTGQCLAMPDIAHWKNTGSDLPKTLENLSASHKIQEIKFSIPETSHGDKFILIKNQFGSATFPFTVRPKTFEVTLDETNFEVQFDRDITIPLNITLDEDHAVLMSLSDLPSLGRATIIDNKISYIPSGTFGNDNLTVLITDNNKTVEQTLEFLVSDRAPHLAFSDLISGPSKGLGDKKGSGAIVTVWGFKLGESQNDSVIELCDTNNVCAEAAYVYYWKNADGKLPGGPANLYESHGMQEVAFSIPNISSGAKKIKVRNKYGSSTLRFTVCDGNIYHVMPTGIDTLGDGFFKSPWLTVAKADSIINAGSTLYIHNVTTGSEETDIAIYNNRTLSMSSLEAQFSYVAYPNTRPEVIGYRGFNTYSGRNDITAGFLISKLAFFTAEADEDENNQPVNVRANVTYSIYGTRDGRAVGNYLTDAHPDDITAACPDGQQASIVASSQNSDHVSNFKVFGNHIYDYGCEGSTKFQHTTYISIRSADENRQLIAPEMAWNFLQDNKTTGGLHYFDENHKGVDCGQFITSMNIHDNVIVNQAGPALAYGANCPVNTTFNFYNNVAINVGLRADFNDETTNGSLNNAVAIAIGHDQVTSEINFENNIFYKWNSDDQQEHSMACIGFSAGYSNATINWNSNICYTETDLHFIWSNYLGNDMESKISGNNNTWYTSIKSPINALTPFWDSNPIVIDPLISIDGSKINISSESPLIERSERPLLRGIYGQLRSSPTTVGAIEFISD